jgi:predicted small secreted protein
MKFISLKGHAMRKMSITLAVLGSLALAGCSTVIPPGNGVSEVEKAVERICGFIPAVGVIAALINIGGFGSYLDLATRICAAVTGPAPRSVGRSGARAIPRLNGVELKGRFIR